MERRGKESLFWKTCVFYSIFILLSINLICVFVQKNANKRQYSLLKVRYPYRFPVVIFDAGIE